LLKVVAFVQVLAALMRGEATRAGLSGSAMTSFIAAEVLR